MPAITNELLYHELLKLDRSMQAVEHAMHATSVEFNRALWELEAGRQRIDRTKGAFESQQRRRLEQSVAKSAID